jgi:uncharacterized protein (DUF3820 family)
MLDTDMMPFGKYGPDKGDHRKMEDVPASYLLWLYDEGCNHLGVRDYIYTNLTTLMKECPDWIPPDERD